MSLVEAADRALLETSRTFYLPILGLPPNIREAVTSAYLCLRAIDEIEDHAGLTCSTKIWLLRNISAACRDRNVVEVERICCRNDLPEVTNRLGDWIRLAPNSVASLIWDVTSAMAQRMAYWASRNWRFHSRSDLDSYTFGVAGTVGVLLSDLWSWYDGTKADQVLGIGFGRGLQAVNILRNRNEDLARGVDFFPVGWSEDILRVYAKQNLSLANMYVEALPVGIAQKFCRVPLILAHATLEALQRGEDKLSRDAVFRLVGADANHELSARNLK